MVLIFGGHADDGNIVVGVEAQRAGMREVHSSTLAAALAADHGDSAGFMSGDQETAELDESPMRSLGAGPFWTISRIFPRQLPELFF